MKISISSDNEQFVEASLERGQYVDSNALFDEAIRLLRRRDDIVRAVNAGVDQLDNGQSVDGNAVFDRLIAKHSSNSNPQSD
jgi:antitoxin ParD1/3/4